MQGKGDGKNNKKPSLNLATAPTREVRRNSLDRRPRRAGSIIEILARKSSAVKILLKIFGKNYTLTELKIFLEVSAQIVPIWSQSDSFLRASCNDSLLLDWVC